MGKPDKFVYKRLLSLTLNVGMNNCTVNIGLSRTPEHRGRGQLDPRLRRGSGSISISECNLDTGTSTISTQTRSLHYLDIYTLSPLQIFYHFVDQ